MPGHDGNCTCCGLPNLPAHDEACLGRQDYRISRHEVVKHALAAGLRMIPRVKVEVEPFMPDLRRRNDIRVKRIGFGYGEEEDIKEEYDLQVSVLAVPSNQWILAVAKPPPDDSSLFKQTFYRIQSALAVHARRKVLALPVPIVGHPVCDPFHPLVMLSGGIMEKEMFEKWKRCKALLSDSVSHSWMLSSVSICLVKARGRTFRRE